MNDIRVLFYKVRSCKRHTHIFVAKRAKRSRDEPHNQRKSTLSRETKHSSMGEKEEEDYGALIYRESQLRKAEAVAAEAAKDDAKKKDRSAADVSSTRRRSTRAFSAGSSVGNSSLRSIHRAITSRRRGKDQCLRMKRSRR